MKTMNSVITEEEASSMGWGKVAGIISVRELKRVVAMWPEKDVLGNPTEVWISSNHGVSDPESALKSYKLLYGKHPYEMTSEERKSLGIDY